MDIHNNNEQIYIISVIFNLIESWLGLKAKNSSLVDTNDKGGETMDLKQIINYLEIDVISPLEFVQISFG